MACLDYWKVTTVHYSEGLDMLQLCNRRRRVFMSDIIWSKNDEYNNMPSRLSKGKHEVMIHSQQQLTSGISSYWHTCNSLLSTFSNLSKGLSSLQNERTNDKPYNMRINYLVSHWVTVAHWLYLRAVANQIFFKIIILGVYLVWALHVWGRQKSERIRKFQRENIEDCEQKVRPILLQTVMKGMADSCFSCWFVTWRASLILLLKWMCKCGTELVLIVIDRH